MTPQNKILLVVSIFLVFAAIAVVIIVLATIPKKKELESGELIKRVFTEENFKFDKYYWDRYFPPHFYNEENFPFYTILEKAVRITCENMNTGLDGGFNGGEGKNFNIASFFMILSEKNAAYKNMSEVKKDLQVSNANDAAQILVGKIFTSKFIPIKNKQEFVSFMFFQLLINDKDKNGNPVYEISKDGIFLSKNADEQTKQKISQMGAQYKFNVFISLADGKVVSFADFSDEIVTFFGEKLKKNFNTDWTNIYPYFLLDSPDDRKKFDDMDIDFSNMYELDNKKYLAYEELKSGD